VIDRQQLLGIIGGDLIRRADQKREGNRERA
jgi:hypothetical protein